MVVTILMVIMMVKAKCCTDTGVGHYTFIICSFLDVNECLEENSCDVNATCINKIGTYDCQCNVGFSGDGFNCSSKWVHTYSSTHQG